ncbi:MAG TPA: YciI family protein [Thermoanaerobaculia bacterium]|nr:YciI family protein [Thermoanaerobaculia bacterium]
MKVVMHYEVAPDGMAKAQANFAARRARLSEFHARGVLLMAGPFANPLEGAMGVFTNREAAEEFIQGDPLVINGVIAKWTLRECSYSKAPPLSGLENRGFAHSGGAASLCPRLHA